MRGVSTVVAAAVLGFVAWAVPAGAEAVGVNSPDGGARAAELDNWSRIRICDTKVDGQGVYSRYFTNNGSGAGNVGEYGGAGQCTETGRLGNKVIARFSACTDMPGVPDNCSAYVYQP